MYTHIYMVAKIVRTPERSENIDPLLPPKHDLISLCSWNMQMVAVALFLSTFNFNIWYVHLLQQLQQHISLA